MEKTTLVLGASSNPERFSYTAVRRLQQSDIPVVAVGNKEADLGDILIHKGLSVVTQEIHTVTMYLSAKYQKQYYSSILALKPKRIIFNPGTANPEFAAIARRNGIQVVTGCMLVMLKKGTF
jgi:predicted CoA-binding protein